jgi:hypothetical protein
MSALPVYPACPIKRDRATKSKMALRLAGLFVIVEAMRPMTVRQVFYQATICQIVEKSERGYDKVQICAVRDMCLLVGSSISPAGNASRERFATSLML